MTVVGRPEEGGLWDPQEAWGEGKEGVQLVFCVSARDKPEGLGLLGE